MTVASQFLPGMVNLPFQRDIATRLLSLLDSLLGAAVGARSFTARARFTCAGAAPKAWALAMSSSMAMVGAFLGMKLTVFTIFAASLAGSLFGLATVLVVWIKRTHRFTRASGAEAAACPRGRGPGSPRKWSIAIIKCRSAFSWAAWRCSRFSWAINF